MSLHHIRNDFADKIAPEWYVGFADFLSFPHEYFFIAGSTDPLVFLDLFGQHASLPFNNQDGNLP